MMNPGKGFTHGQCPQEHGYATLWGRVTAVYGEYGSCGIGDLIRGQEQDPGCYLLGFSHSFQGGGLRIIVVVWLQGPPKSQ